MNLKNKRILITAGPTWVPIDSVRVISNTATGETGVLLAESLKRLGAKVTLILGPGGFNPEVKGIRVINFKFFDELNYLLKKETGKNNYDLLIHSAAVSDYRPGVYNKGKIRSGKKHLKLTLKPAPKIIDSLRKLSPETFLAGFKFEINLGKDNLVRSARRLMKRAGLDLVIANTLLNKHYLAYLVKKEGYSGPFLSKDKMVKGLINLIRKEYAGN